MFRKFNIRFLMLYITASIMKCFQCWDGEEGAPAGGEPPALDTDSMTIDDLKAIMQTAIKDSETATELKELKEQMKKVERKAIFPGMEDDDGSGGAESYGKSIIDMSYFSKAHAGLTGARTGHPQRDGEVLGKQLVQMGGPFKRLSPEMETFAKMILMKGKPENWTQGGINLKDYNSSVNNQYVQAGIHLKAAAGMSEGILADGGALVPVEFMATVIEFATQVSPILSQVWRLPMNSNVLKIPKLVQAAGSYFGGITLYSPDEGDLKDDTKPALERLQFDAKKLIGLIYLTDELIADSMINVINYVTGLFVRAFQYDIERRVVAGTGVGPCLGIISDPAINSVQRQTTGTVTFNDVMNLDASIDENITNLAWMTRKATQITLQGLKDLNGRPIFMADYATFRGEPAHPMSMISYPVYKTRNIPVIGEDGDLIVGDLSQYILAMRQDMTIGSSEHVRFVYDETTLRFVMRLDGKPAVSIAFSKLVGNS